MMYDNLLFCSNCGRPMETRELEPYSWNSKTGKPYRRFARECSSLRNIRWWHFWRMPERHDYRVWQRDSEI